MQSNLTLSAACNFLISSYSLILAHFLSKKKQKKPIILWFTFIKSATQLPPSRSPRRAVESAWRKSSLKQTSWLRVQQSAAATCSSSAKSIGQNSQTPKVLRVWDYWDGQTAVKICKALETSYLVLFALILNHLLSAETLSQSTTHTSCGKKKPSSIIIQPQVAKKDRWRRNMSPYSWRSKHQERFCVSRTRRYWSDHLNADVIPLPPNYTLTW